MNDSHNSQNDVLFLSNKISFDYVIQLHFSLVPSESSLKELSNDTKVYGVSSFSWKVKLSGSGPLN